jgi:hypothetical protein
VGWAGLNTLKTLDSEPTNARAKAAIGRIGMDYSLEGRPSASFLAVINKVVNGGVKRRHSVQNSKASFISFVGLIGFRGGASDPPSQDNQKRRFRPGGAVRYFYAENSGD